MSQKTEVKCDGCGADITTTGNCEDWRLGLHNEVLPLRGNTATLMGIPPPIPRSLHFCGVPCLAGWLARDNPGALEQFNRIVEWRAAQDSRRA